jgi:hypothetical protein
MLPHRVNDLRWTWNGDLVIGENGDLVDTTAHQLLSFVQEIKTRVRSELYDWQLHPYLGAALIDLVGEPNNREIAEQGKARIISALARDGFVARRYIKVAYVPVDRHHLMYRLTITVPDMIQGEQIELSLLLDTSEFEILFL